MTPNGTHKTGTLARRPTAATLGALADRLPPQNIEAEQGVLGGILLDNETLHDVAPILKPDDFWRDTHQVIYRRILALHTEGRPVDPLSLVEALEQHDEFQRIGGHAALAEILGRGFVAANAAYYAGIVKAKSLLRTVIAAANQMLRDAYADRLTAQDIVREAERLIFDLSSQQSGGRVRPLADSLTDAMDSVQRRIAGEIAGITSGFPDLDWIVGGFRKGHLIIVAARPAMGKAQPLDAGVLTPSGFVRMGDISVGDQVIGADGKPHKVIGVFPQGIKEVYRVTMTDGTSTECCDEHLWFTQTRNERRRGLAGSVRQLSEIRSTLMIEHGSRLNHVIPLVQPVEFVPRPEPEIDPYLMGIYLGDGRATGNVVVTNPEPDIQERFAAGLPAGDCVATIRDGITNRVRRTKKNNAQSTMRQAIGSLGLDKVGSLHKFVPEEYLFGSIDCRQAILRGLLDTDGYVADSGQVVEYSTSSERLASDVEFLVRSLGGIVRTLTRIPKFTYRGEVRRGAKSFRLYIRFLNGFVPVSSQKHLAKWRHNVKHLEHRSIRSIEPIGPTECQCITIDSDDRLYVTDDFIVTHNSAIAWGISEHAAREGNRVLYVSLEMPDVGLAERALAAESRVDGGKLRNGFSLNNNGHLERISEADLERLGRAHLSLQQLPIFVDDTPTQPMLQILSTARKLQLRQGLDLIVVDYLQLIAPDDPSRSTQEQVSMISRRLKALAREIDVPVIALSQLNRKVEEREDRTPRLADLRDSGAIEQDADIVILMHRPDYYDPNDQPGVAIVNVAKNRWGATGGVKLTFLRHLTRFESLAAREAPIDADMEF